MSYDMDMCDAMRALMEDYHPIYWIEPCYEDGKCELFIEVKED